MVLELDLQVIFLHVLHIEPGYQGVLRAHLDVLHHGQVDEKRFKVEVVREQNNSSHAGPVKVIICCVIRQACLCCTMFKKQM